MRSILHRLASACVVSGVACAHPAFALTGAEVYKIAASSIVVVRTPSSLGSGVLLRSNLLATNCHVVKDFDTVSIEYFGVTVSGTVVGRNDRHDVCAVRLTQPLKGASPVRSIRRWETVDVGENIYALGAPTGFKYTFTSGIVSQKREHKDGQLIQFDAAISPGNSGGGLFDASGSLMGLPSFMVVETENVQNLNFAWSVNVFPDPLRSAMASLTVDGGRVRSKPSTQVRAPAMSEERNLGRAWRAAFDAGRLPESLSLALAWTKESPDMADAWVARGLSADAINPGSGFGFFKHALECNHSHQKAMYYGAISARRSGNAHDYRRLLGLLRRANSSLAQQLEETAK